MESRGNEPPNPGRRALIKKTMIAAGTLATAALVNREIQTIENGVKTNVGIFYPLYEHHDIGIAPEDFPSNINGYFKEMNFYSSLGQSISTIRAEDVIEETDIQKPVADILINQTIPIILGDMPVPVGYFEFSRVDQSKPRVALAGAIAGATLAYNALGPVLQKAGLLKANEGITRRKFITRLAGISAAVSIGPAAADKLLSMLLPAEVAQKDAIQRIFIRLNGLIKHTHPEDHMVFFRNVVMADKMLTVAEEMKKHSGRNPRIAFQVGAAHAGIEDFLVAGHNFTRWLLLQYPEDFLWDVVEESGGIKVFSSARSILLKSPTGVKSDETIVDEALLKSLEEKFASRLNKERERRQKDIAQIQSVYKKYLSPGLSAQLNQIMERYLTMTTINYEKSVRKNSFNLSSGSRATSYDLALNPEEQKEVSRDISIMFEEQDGKRINEEIDLFVNKQGDITARNDRDSQIIPMEGLLEIATNILGAGPWKIYPVAAEMIVKDEEVSKRYVVRTNGAIEIVSVYKND